jgi:cephalosporin-C deacetylase
LRVGAPEGPRDFASFWQTLYAQTRRVAPRAERRQISDIAPNIETFEIEFDSIDSFRVGGWLTMPKDLAFTRGVVVSHGYGGRTAPEASIPGPPAACIFPCGRGFHRSARPDIPDNGARHVLHGIESRDTYSHRGCAADIWAAASALLESFPQIKRLHFSGGSFGGGIGALALPWDDRIDRAYLEVPSFGNHTLRVTMPCHGSGEAVRLYHQRHPEVVNVLQYFDAATAAHHMTRPVFVAPALFDPAVPPPGQFAVANALAGQHRLFVLDAGHFEWPGMQAQHDQLRRELGEWFAR